MTEIKTKKLKRVINIRITDEDYQALIGFNNIQKREVSRLLRNLIQAALAMVKEK
jgi:hypothetical protein